MITKTEIIVCLVGIVMIVSFLLTQ